jgi:transglutaminase/protease-like cytokinesis protein 3
MVKVNGVYTLVDATWDDPVTRSSKGILSHKYFNISDKQISKTHKWDTSKYPKGVSIQK